MIIVLTILMFRHDNVARINSGVSISLCLGEAMGAWKLHHIISLASYGLFSFKFIEFCIIRPYSGITLNSEVRIVDNSIDN